MKSLLVCCSLLFSICLSAQKNQNIEVSFGLGGAFLGSGDLTTLVTESEINYKLNSYFSTGLNIGYGRNNFIPEEYLLEETTVTNFIQCNSNLYFSPFKNDKNNTLKIGTGISVNRVTDAEKSFVDYNDDPGTVYYSVEHRNSVGFNIILEQSFCLSEQSFFSIKAYTQPFLNGDIHSGILLKLGLRI